MRIMLKSKIHQARVSDANIDYEGSITIDRKLMEAADILPFEKVQVTKIDNNARFVTYAIESEKGEIYLNPKLVYVDTNNAITETKEIAVTMPFKGGNRCA